MLEYLVKNVGEDRIVMGSDYCFPIAYEPVRNVMDNTLLAPQPKQAIVAGNARRLLEL